MYIISFILNHYHENLSQNIKLYVVKLSGLITIFSDDWVLFFNFVFFRKIFAVHLTVIIVVRFLKPIPYQENPLKSYCQADQTHAIFVYVSHTLTEVQRWCIPLSDIILSELHYGLPVTMEHWGSTIVVLSGTSTIKWYLTVTSLDVAISLIGQR